MSKKIDRPAAATAETVAEKGYSEKIISDFSGFVNGRALRAALIDQRLTARQATVAVKGRFPKFDKSLMSKCLAPEKYGILLHPEGYNALGVKTPFRPRRGDGHKLTHKIAGRLPEDKFNRLQQLIRADGYKTVQDWVVAQVDAYIARVENGQKN